MRRLTPAGRHRRARALAGSLAAAGAALLLVGCRPIPPDATLADLAAQRGHRTIGTAVEGHQLDRPADAALIAREFSVVTPENAMKWGPVHPERTRYDFAAADRIVEFARAHGQAVRGHTLVWHQQNPAWLVDGSFTRDELVGILRDHIHTVVGRYRGEVAHWDVVNEAVDDQGRMRDNLWLRGIGPEYVELAFRFAHEADPSARLFYNDYLIERAGPKADAVDRLVTGLLERGVPIEGVGFQMHVFTPGLMPSAGDLAAQFRRYADRGLDVAVTELDVALLLPSSPQALVDQAAAYGRAASACLSVARCKTFVMWGYTDGDSWIPTTFPGFGDALVFDADLRPKPAYESLCAVLWWNVRA